MSAEFTPMQDKPNYDDLFRRLCVIVDVCDSLRVFADHILSKTPQREGDGNFYLVHECVGRICKEASEAMCEIEICKSKEGVS